MNIRTLLRTFFKGIKVGEDAHDNRFYTDRHNNRWVIYKNLPENISPEWLSWLHHSVKETPSKIIKHSAIVVAKRLQKKHYEIWHP